MTSVRDQATRPRRTWPLLVGLAAVTLAADQSSKVWALGALTPGDPRPLLGRFFQLNLIFNSGAAFSLAEGQTWLLTLVAVVIGAVVIWHAPRIRSIGWAVAAGLVLGGLLGNLYDRLFRPPAFGQGHVVDFLDYNGWFIGNVADVAIVGAAVLLAVLSFLDVRYDGSSAQADPPAGSASDTAPTGKGATRA